MDQFASNMAQNELMVQECIKCLRQDPIKTHGFIMALLEGQTVSFHGYRFTNYDTQRIYQAINKGRNC